MKSLLMKFADNVLSKEDLKALKGGKMPNIVCTVTVSYPGGYSTYMGQCASSSLSECQSYSPPCPVGTCTMECDYFLG